MDNTTFVDWFGDTPANRQADADSNEVWDRTEGRR